MRGIIFQHAPLKDRARLLRRVTILDDVGCWIWTGARKPRGYGNFKLAGRWIAPHILAWLWTTGSRRGRRLVDHLCRNRMCVAPHHLELVTHARNTLRGVGPTAAQHRRRCETGCRRCR